MKKKWMIFSLALALLGASSVGTAYAYFTTNARADGEYGIELGNDTDITEDVDDLTKSIAVRNNENSQAVFVRVKLFYPDEGGSPVSQVFVEGEDGFSRFIRAIPYNFYAILTILMMVSLVLMNVDFGPMKTHEANARKGDLFSMDEKDTRKEQIPFNPKGKVIDLLIPIITLIIFCVIGMIYTGEFFDGASFVEAFSNSDASVGLMLGSAFGLLFAFVYYFVRRSMSFKEMMGCIPEGFKAMVPAILILTFAWSLKGMTDSLGAKFFVRDFVNASAAGFQPDSDTVEQLTKRFPESPFKDVPTSKGYYVYLLRAVGYAQ